MTGSVRMPSAVSGTILSMCLPNSTLVTSSAYGVENDEYPERDRRSRDQVDAADHQRPPGQEDVQLAQAMLLEPERRSDIEDRQEESGERENDDQRAVPVGEQQHDQPVDERQADDRVAQLGLGHPARQDRMRRVQGADVALGVDAAGHVEVVVDQVVRGVGDDQADDRQHHGDPVDGDYARGSPGGLGRQQGADRARPDGHREHGGAGHDQPLADACRAAAPAAGWPSA